MGASHVRRLGALGEESEVNVTNEVGKGVLAPVLEFSLNNTSHLQFLGRNYVNLASGLVIVSNQLCSCREGIWWLT